MTVSFLMNLSVVTLGPAANLTPDSTPSQRLHVFFIFEARHLIICTLHISGIINQDFKIKTYSSFLVQGKLEIIQKILLHIVGRLCFSFSPFFFIQEFIALKAIPKLSIGKEIISFTKVVVSAQFFCKLSHIFCNYLFCQQNTFEVDIEVFLCLVEMKLWTYLHWQCNEYSYYFIILYH